MTMKSGSRNSWEAMEIVYEQFSHIDKPESWTSHDVVAKQGL